MTAETPARTGNLNSFWRPKCVCHNKRCARARAIECGVTSLMLEIIYFYRKGQKRKKTESARSWELKDLAVHLAWKSCMLFPSTVMNLHCKCYSVRFIQTREWSPNSRSNRPILIYYNSASNNRSQFETLGNKYRVCGVYSPEPRSGVYCLRLNFKISKLVYWTVSDTWGSVSRRPANHFS